MQMSDVLNQLGGSNEVKIENCLIYLKIKSNQTNNNNNDNKTNNNNENGDQNILYANNEENNNGKYELILKEPSTNEDFFNFKFLQNNKNNVKKYFFDYILPIRNDNQIIQNKIGMDMLSYALDGFNCSIITNGERGSGKSFTLFGVDPRTIEGKISMSNMSNNVLNYSYMGLIEWLIRSFFEMNQYKEEVNENESEIYKLGISCWEIKNNECRDIFEINSNNIDIHTYSNKNIGLEHNIIECPNIEIFLLLFEWIKKESSNFRYLGKYSNNNTTSNHGIGEWISIPNISHLFIRLTILDLNKSIVSTIHFVDLAGFSKSDDTNMINENEEIIQSNELYNLNRDNFTLNKIINEIYQKNKDKDNNNEDSNQPRLISARDSILTKNLLPLLIGNSKLWYLGCVNNNETNYRETKQILDISQKWKEIITGCMKNEINISDLTFLSFSYIVNALKIYQDNNNFQPVQYNYDMTSDDIKSESINSDSLENTENDEEDTKNNDMSIDISSNSISNIDINNNTNTTTSATHSRTSSDESFLSPSTLSSPMLTPRSSESGLLKEHRDSPLNNEYLPIQIKISALKSELNEIMSTLPKPYETVQENELNNVYEETNNDSFNDLNENDVFILPTLPPYIQNQTYQIDSSRLIETNDTIVTPSKNEHQSIRLSSEKKRQHKSIDLIQTPVSLSLSPLNSTIGRGSELLNVQHNNMNNSNNSYYDNHNNNIDTDEDAKISSPSSPIYTKNNESKPIKVQKSENTNIIESNNNRPEQKKEKTQIYEYPKEEETFNWEGYERIHWEERLNDLDLLNTVAKEGINPITSLLAVLREERKLRQYKENEILRLQAEIAERDLKKDILADELRAENIRLNGIIRKLKLETTYNDIFEQYESELRVKYIEISDLRDRNLKLNMMAYDFYQHIAEINDFDFNNFDDPSSLLNDLIRRDDSVIPTLNISLNNLNELEKLKQYLRKTYNEMQLENLNLQRENNFLRKNKLLHIKQKKILHDFQRKLEKEKKDALLLERRAEEAIIKESDLQYRYQHLLDEFKLSKLNEETVLNERKEMIQEINVLRTHVAALEKIRENENARKRIESVHKQTKLELNDYFTNDDIYQTNIKHKRLHPLTFTSSPNNSTYKHKKHHHLPFHVFMGENQNDY